MFRLVGRIRRISTINDWKVSKTSRFTTFHRTSFTDTSKASSTEPTIPATSTISTSNNTDLGDGIDVPAVQTWKTIPQFTSSIYLELTKSRLTAFVLLTTMCGYTMAPGVSTVPILLLTTLGTALCVASANSLNQWTEGNYDAQMVRTRNRPMVRHAISSVHAFSFGISSGFIGTSLLICVNPIAALLGFGNIVLYTCVYTPMKRFSVYNTWPGAVVGAIPPIIGWVACTGTIDIRAILLGFALYAWQFPHFNALSWNLRPDYSKAGYRMMSVIDPGMNAEVALKYALAMFPISLGCAMFGLTSYWFVIDSALVNGYMTYFAWRFWRFSDDKSARSLFFSSLVHLPVFLILLMIHKKEEEVEVEALLD